MSVPTTIDALAARLANSKKEIDEHFRRTGNRPSHADWIIASLVQQSMRPDGKGEYFSEFIRAYSDALRHLCRVGIMESCGYDVDGEDRVFAAKFAHKDMML